MAARLPRSSWRHHGDTQGSSTMPQFLDTVVIPAPVDVVFDFFRRPANVALVAQPELHVQVVAAPQLLEQGSQVEVQGRRWGITHRSVLDITALEIRKLMIEEQRAGPFRQWKHVYRFEAIGQTTRLTDEVTFEP